MALPDYQTLMLPVLRIAAEGETTLPHVVEAVASEFGVTSEERKMVDEVPKILGAPVPLDVTCVRVPVVVGHAEAVTVQTREPASVADVERVLRDAPGVRLVTGPEPPTPRDAAGGHDVLVGRVRASRALENGVQLWVVADNLLKGAAWNAVR